MTTIAGRVCLAGLMFLVLAIGYRSPAAEARRQAAPIPPTAWLMPADVGGAATDEDWIRFGWDSFVAVNWPADNKWPAPGDGGKPDKSTPITDPRAASRPAVWQTYLAPGQVFRDNGQAPGGWNTPALPFTTTVDP